MHKYHGAFSIGLLTDKLHIEGPIWKERTSFSFSARAIPTLFFKNLIVDKDDTYSDKYNYYFYDVNAKVNHKFSDRSRIFLSFYKGKDHYHYDSDYHGDNYDNSIKNYSKDNSHLNWGNTMPTAAGTMYSTASCFATPPSHTTNMRWGWTET